MSWENIVKRRLDQWQALSDVILVNMITRDGRIKKLKLKNSKYQVSGTKTSRR